MSTFHTFLELDGVEDVPVVVEYVAVKESGDGWNEPKVQAHIEIESVKTANGNEVTLTKAQERAMQVQISGWLDEMHERENGQ